MNVVGITWVVCLCDGSGVGHSIAVGGGSGVGARDQGPSDVHCWQDVCTGVARHTRVSLVGVVGGAAASLGVRFVMDKRGVFV